jgi:YidC/Oxa1 family membrane protein insertase
LSAPDPLYIMPIAIVISMFAVQKITPMVGMDQVQARMMQVMMPLMIGFISWNLASGLTLYWVMGNVIAFLQQIWMNNSKLGKDVREHLAKRQLKKA